MKRYFRICLLLLSLLALPAGAAGQSAAQDGEILAKVLEWVASRRISASYRYETGGEVTVTGSGTLLLDGGCYLLRGNGLDVYCDGVTRWTVDPAAKEVYIEAAAEGQDYFSHPEAFVSQVSGLREEGGTITGVFTDSGKGTVIRFSFSSIVGSPQQHRTQEFAFDTAALDASWVVTDLR